MFSDDHAPQRYVAGEGMGESCDWNDLLITTVGCGFTWVAPVPQAASSSIKMNPDPNAMKRSLFIVILAKIYPINL